MSYQYGRMNKQYRTGRGCNKDYPSLGDKNKITPMCEFPTHVSTERFHGGVEYISEKMNRRGSTSDNIYFNIEINNPLITANSVNFQYDGIKIQAEYNETLTQPLLHNPADYYLTIARFAIPGDGIPIVYMPIVEGSTQNNPNLTPYLFTLSFGGVDFPVNIIYYSLSGVPVPRAPSQNGPTFTRPQSPYYYVFSYIHMVTMMNIALQTAFNALKAAFPAAPPTQPPFFIFDETVNLLRLVVQNSYSPVVAGGPTIEIWTNAATYYRFLVAFNTQFFTYNAVNGKTFKFIIPPEVVSQFPAPPVINTTVPPLFNNLYAIQAPNPATSLTFAPRDYTQTINNADLLTNLNAGYFVLSQEYVVLQYWNSFKSIVFTTTSLPIQAEYIPSNNIIGGLPFTQGGVVGNGAINYKPILTDFVPNLPQAGDARTQLIYVPNGPYRLLSMIGAAPIQKIDIQLFWQDTDDILHPLIIHTGKDASIKLLFIRKE